jgi:hypothetical protein
MKQTISSDFGAAAKRKQDFFGQIFDVDKEVTFNRDRFTNLVSNGRNLISAMEAVTAN